MAAVEAKKITLKSSDGEEFEIDELVAMESQTLKNMIEDDCADAVILLPNITSKIPAVILLPNVASKIPAKVIEYCMKHVEAAPKPESADADKENTDLKAWDAEYVQVDQATLFDLILVYGRREFYGEDNGGSATTTNIRAA